MAKKQPHILIITMDGLRCDALGCMGNDLASTPHIDRLASEGAMFTRAYCSQPICMPCRSSIMSGRYPSAHGVWQNGIALEDTPDLLPAVFSRGGYATHCYGKCHFTPWLPGLNPDEAAHHGEYRGDGPYYGFEQVRVTDHSEDDRYFDWLKKHFPKYVDLARNPAQEKQDNPIAWKSALPAEASKSRYIADLTIEQIKKHDGDQPLFLWASFIDPHHPYNPSAPFSDMFDEAQFPAPPNNNGPWDNMPGQYANWRKKLKENWNHTNTAQKHYQKVRRMYQGKLAQVDAEMGRILAALDKQNLLDETIILFMSDHGTMLGDYGLMQVGEYSQEALIKIPFVWRVPEKLSGKKCTTKALASAVDVLPTLTELSGLTTPQGVQGKSLAGVLSGEQEKVRDQLLVENRWGQNPPEGFQTLVTDRYKLSVYSNGKEGELYDLKKDPLEIDNRYDDPALAETQNQLMRQFAVAQLNHLDPLPVRRSSW